MFCCLWIRLFLLKSALRLTFWDHSTAEWWKVGIKVQWQINKCTNVNLGLFKSQTFPTKSSVLLQLYWNMRGSRFKRWCLQVELFGEIIMDFWPWYKIWYYWTNKHMVKIVEVLVLTWLGAIGEKCGSVQEGKADHWEPIHWDDPH